MTSLIHGRDIVMVGQQPWDTPIGSNAKDIAREFSRHNRVLYVNAPLDRNTLLRQRTEPAVQARLRVLRGQEPGLRAQHDNLWVLTPDTLLESINWLPESELYAFCNKMNNRRLARAIRPALRELGFRDFLLFNDNDIFRCFHLPELLAPDVSIYYSRDNMQAVDYWRKHGRRLEPLLIAKSDVCVANSSYLAAYCRQYNTRSYDVGQGCELPPLPPAAAPRPAELRGLPGPLLGYVGALVSSRLDSEVLLSISRQRPDWQLVLIGPEDEAFKASALHEQPNVHFLGPRPPAELALYAQHFAVCLNPQLLNPMTIGNYPRKVDEYLALGKPVVATRTQAMSVFEDHTYLADEPGQYVALIEQALREDNAPRQDQRRALAASHTWTQSVAKIYAAVQDCYARRTAHQDLTARALARFSQAQA